jgi:tripartite-type tricarboxylate transporter receptor subunit TctC
MLRSLGVFLSAAALALPAARAQQPAAIPPLIRIVVPVSAGAINDVVARVVAPALAARLGTSVIVENRAGAAGFIGAAAVAKGPRDGSMLMVYSTSMVTGGATTRNPPVDVLKDLQPVAGLIEVPLVVAASVKSGIRTPSELLEAARTKPEGLNHGHGGVGGLTHLIAELLGDAGKFRLHNIPYKGGAPAVQGLVSGEVDLVISTHSAIGGVAKAGRVRLVAVTSREPTRNNPDLPTMASVLPGFIHSLWIGVWTSPGTPPELIQRYHRELLEIAKSKEVQDLAALEDGTSLSWTPEQFAAQIRDGYEQFKRVAAEKNIVLE